MTKLVLHSNANSGLLWLSAKASGLSGPSGSHIGIDTPSKLREIQWERHHIQGSKNSVARNILLGSSIHVLSPTSDIVVVAVAAEILAQNSNSDW
jgi:hypothetical protein